MAKKKRKRANNEGSVFQRKNESWRAQVTIDGNRLSHTTKTQREGREWVRKMLNQIDAGLTYESTQITLGDFMKDWLKSTESSIRPTTLTQYQQVVRDYILPALGEIKIRELRPDQIQRLYTRKLEDGLGERSVRTIHAVLHTALNQALKIGILDKNPASVTSPPKQNRREMQFYDETQVQKMLIAAQTNNDRYLALFKLAVTTGMRQGELLGLKWTDLDWQRGSLQVQRQLKRKKGGGFRYASPKSKAGSRTVILGLETLNTLKAHRERLFMDHKTAEDRWIENDLMFPNTFGSPTQPDKLLKRFKKLIKHAGLPEIRFHDLRHTAASLMLNNGVPVIVVSRRLGHSQPSITLDVYGHLIPTMQNQVAELMDQLTTPIKVKFPNT